MCGGLIASIPKMKVRTLEFGQLDDIEQFKPRRLHAVTRNASLYRVAGKLYPFYDTIEDLFNDGDYRKLNYYAARNKGLSQWPASVFSLPKKACKGIRGSAGDWTRYILSHSPRAGQFCRTC
jgi:hypothetical protein